MSNLPAKRAVRLGPPMVGMRAVLAAVARLALFHSEFIQLSRNEVSDHIATLVDFLAEVNDESPKA